MKVVKFLLSLLLVCSLVACSDTGAKQNETTVNSTSFLTLFNEYGAEGVTVLHNTFLVDGDTELLYAGLGNIDATYYNEVKTILEGATFTEGGSAGNLIARIDLKKAADITYMYVYDNGTISVRKHPEEVFYTVSQDTIDALMNVCENAYVAYELYRAGN